MALEQFELENGLTVNFYDDPTAKTVAMGVVVFGGSSVDPKGQKGMAHLHEHMSYRSTENYSSERKLFHTVEHFGGEMDAETDFGYTLYKVELPILNFYEGLKVLLNIVFKPRFRNDDLVSEKKIVIEECLDNQNDDTEVRDHFVRKNFFNHTSIVTPRVGFEKAVKCISIQDLRNFHNKTTTAINCQIIITGNIPYNAKEVVRRLFGLLELKKGKDLRIYNQSIKDPLTKEVFLKDRVFLNTEATIVSVWPLMSIREIAAFRLFQDMFAFDLSSPMQHELRRKMGLRYCSFNSYFLPGVQYAEFSCATNLSKTKEAIERFWNVLNRTTNNLNRFRFAKSSRIGSLRTRNPDPEDRLQEITEHLMYNNFIEDKDNIKLVQSLTFSEVQEVVKRCLSREKSLAIITHC